MMKWQRSTNSKPIKQLLDTGESKVCSPKRFFQVISVSHWHSPPPRCRKRPDEAQGEGSRRLEGGQEEVEAGMEGVGGHVGRLSTRLHPLCHCRPRGNRPSNGKVVPHLHNHYRGDRKSFWETINVVLRDLKKKKKMG